MDENEKQQLYQRLAKMEERLEKLTPSGLTSKTYWSRLTTFVGYYVLAGIFYATILFFLSVVFGLFGYLVSLAQ